MSGIVCNVCGGSGRLERSSELSQVSAIGELIVTDRKHAEKTATFSAVDTARLALALKRWATLIDVREAA